MLVGAPPFKSPSEYLTFQRIAAREYTLPEEGAGAPSPQAADLISRLLALDPGARLGAADLAELRCHAFFAGIDWEGLRRQPTPAFVQVREVEFKCRDGAERGLALLTGWGALLKLLPRSADAAVGGGSTLCCLLAGW